MMEVEVVREKLEQFLRNVVSMNEGELALQQVSLSETFPDYAEDADGLRHLSRLVTAVEAIGDAKFPGMWLRDTA